MKSIINEFKTFISRGNVLELAVGLIMATYFGAIVQSFVHDIIMPPVIYLIAGVDFSELKLFVAERTLDDGTVEWVTINYGAFLNNVITFITVALAIFSVMKMYNNFMKRKAAEPEQAQPPKPGKEEKLLMEIRDLLAEKRGDS